ncbi:MAG: glycosyltransferase family 2 protein [Desulfobulbaceae bacterium]|nr:glycosyltransferase family 2 protein [Desulfobulbaceae bacterium]
MIDIVIPNYNGRQLLDTCLQSIRAQSYEFWRIIVVDNGSSDGSAAYIRQHYPDVQLLTLPENIGFSAAVNRGIEAGEAPLVFLLNNDTELECNCLQQLANAAAASPADFFAAKMINYHERHLLDGAGEGFLRGGAGYRIGTMEADGPPYEVSRQVFGACGGAALYRRQTLREVGLFDADFFAYLEDVDWNLRAARMGKVCRYVAEARVYHIGSATSGSKFNDFTIRLSTRNSFFVLARNYSGQMLVRYSILIGVYQFFWLLFVCKKRQLIPYLRGLAEAAFGWMGMRKKYRQGLSGAEIPPSLLREQLRRAEDEAIASIMRRRSAAGKGNGLLYLYQSLFCSP